MKTAFDKFVDDQVFKQGAFQIMEADLVFGTDSDLAQGQVEAAALKLVLDDGRVMYHRWEYVDKGVIAVQALWAMRPDGTHPGAVWGNAAPKPHCAFQAKPIPGSRKIVFIASAHHAVTGGPVCVLDPAVDANSQDAITRITPGPYPEAESSQIPEYGASPWPLSENYFLVAWSRDRLIFEGEHLQIEHQLDVIVERVGHAHGRVGQRPLLPARVEFLDPLDAAFDLARRRLALVGPQTSLLGEMHRVRQPAANTSARPSSTRSGEARSAVRP